MIGHCACGRVTVELARRPDYVNFCDCSLCARVGGTWCYFEPHEVTAQGERRSWMREDMDDPVVVLHSCPVCSTTTHWTILPEDKRDIVGVNYSPVRA